MSQAIKESLSKIHVPSFDEFQVINEAAKVEMEHYAALVNSVDELKKIFGEKEVGKTGIITSLQKINNLILSGKKEIQKNEAGSELPEETAQAQPAAQTQAQPFAQPAAQGQAQGQSAEIK